MDMLLLDMLDMLQRNKMDMLLLDMLDMLQRNIINVMQRNMSKLLLIDLLKTSLWVDFNKKTPTAMPSETGP